MKPENFDLPPQTKHKVSNYGNYKPEVLERAKRLFKEHSSAHMIAGMLGVPYTTVLTWAKKWGFNTRK